VATREQQQVSEGAAECATDRHAHPSMFKKPVTKWYGHTSPSASNPGVRHGEIFLVRNSKIIPSSGRFVMLCKFHRTGSGRGSAT
jgi:hypothetical protein